MHHFWGQKLSQAVAMKALRLAAVCPSYGAADKILRRLTAYEVCGG